MISEADELRAAMADTLNAFTRSRGGAVPAGIMMAVLFDLICQTLDAAPAHLRKECIENARRLFVEVTEEQPLNARYSCCRSR